MGPGFERGRRARTCSGCVSNDLPASLRSADGLAGAVMAIHDGVATEHLLENDPVRVRSLLADLLTVLLDHARETPQPATANPVAAPTVRPSEGGA